MKHFSSPNMYMYHVEYSLPKEAAKCAQRCLTASPIYLSRLTRRFSQESTLSQGQIQPAPNQGFLH